MSDNYAAGLTDQSIIADEFKSRLKMLVTQLKTLQDESDTQVIEKMANDIIDFIGGLVPIKILETVLDYYKAKEKELAERDIPDLMKEAGVSKVTLEDGTEVRSAMQYSTKIIDQANYETWMNNNGYGELLKHDFLVRGSQADIVREKLQQNGLSFEEKLNEAGAHMTRNKIMRERLEAGESVPPEDVMSLKIFERAIVK